MKVSLLCVALVFIVSIQLALSAGERENNDKKGIKRQQFLENKRSRNLGDVNKQQKSQRGQRIRPGGFKQDKEKSLPNGRSKLQENNNAAHTDHREKRNAFNERRRLIRDATLDVSEILRQNLKEDIQINQKRNLDRKARDVKASKKLQDMVIKKVAEKVK